MTYSLKQYPNVEGLFPSPPEWLVWQENYPYDGQGQVRHIETLTKAKKQVSSYGHRFHCAWAIYHWDGTKYVRQYDGQKDQEKDDNPLFQERIPKGTTKPREIDPDEVDAAIHSIMEASRG